MNASDRAGPEANTEHPCAGSGEDQAQGFALSFRPLAGLDQEQEPTGACGEEGSGGGLGTVIEVEISDDTTAITLPADRGPESLCGSRPLCAISMARLLGR